MSMMQDPEADRIKRVYAGYEREAAGPLRWTLRNPGNVAIMRERSRRLSSLLCGAGCLPLAGRRVLEVGCGAGNILQEFISLGAEPALLSGLDLLEDLVMKVRPVLPEVDLRAGDARAMPYPDAEFDLVVAFTVFSSITDDSVAHQIGREIDRVLKPAGAFVVYDMRYRNPSNPHVRAMKRRDFVALFPGYHGVWSSLTLLPPLARKLGPLTKIAYPLLASFPLLRSHLLAVLLKPTSGESPPARSLGGRS